MHQQIQWFHGDQFPNILKLAKLAVTLPVHTADVERVFSAQNLICTDLRNRISPETQDMLMRVYLEGPKDKKNLDQWIISVIDKWKDNSPCGRLLFSKKKVSATSL